MKKFLLISIYYLIFIKTVFCQTNERTDNDFNKNQFYKSRILTSPNNLQFHEAYINSTKNVLDLLPIYDLWIKKFKESYNIPFAIGKALFNKENINASKYLIIATQANTNLAEAWYYLAIDAQRKGNIKDEIYLSNKAYNLENTSGLYTFQYAYSYYKKNKSVADSLMIEVAYKFNSENFGAKALLILSLKEENIIIKKVYLKQLFEFYKTIPNEDFNVGMNIYYSLLINEKSYQDALDLSLSLIINNDKNRLNWRHFLDVSRKYLLAERLERQNLLDTALVIYNQIKLKDSFSQTYIDSEETLLELKANILSKTNRSDSAYKIILKEYSLKPNDNNFTKLLEYGNLINKDSIQIKSDVKRLRCSNVVIAKDIKGKSYLDSKEVSLSDFRGKVVLLSFWFPSCGPCRKEMPFIEKTLKNINRDSLVYLGINVESKQDNFVLEFIKQNGFSFLPLKDINETKGNLTPYGFPANYLIDKNGQIVFSNFLIDENNQDMLRLMINDLVSY